LCRWIPIKSSVQNRTELDVLSVLMARNRWTLGAAALAAIALAVLAIRWMVFGSLTMSILNGESIEDNWANTITKLGIESRFPPEEDFVVGDLLALVVEDDPYQSAENRIEDPKKVSFPRRAVKLAYVDAKSALNDEYARLPIFTDVADPPQLGTYMGVNLQTEEDRAMHALLQDPRAMMDWISCRGPDLCRHGALVGERRVPAPLLLGQNVSQCRRGTGSVVGRASPRRCWSRRCARWASTSSWSTLEGSVSSVARMMPSQVASSRRLHSKSAAGPKRDFSAGVLLKDLPLAGFPHLRIQGTRSGSAGISGAGFWASFGASNKEIEELELGEIRTYGLPSVRAFELLRDYCAQKATKDNCTEETARKHLKSLPGVGQRIFTKNVVDTKGGEGFAVKVEVVMVYRIYLTRSIKNRWEASRSERGGGGEAFSPSETQPANPVSTPGANNGDNEELKRRIDDLERQMAAMRNVNASVANAAYNRQSYFRGAFERPVAIGFRGIRVDFEKKARQ